MLLLDSFGAAALLNLGPLFAQLFDLDLDSTGSRFPLCCCHLHPFCALQKCTTSPSPTGGFRRGQRGSGDRISSKNAIQLGAGLKKNSFASQKARKLVSQYRRVSLVPLKRMHESSTVGGLCDL